MVQKVLYPSVAFVGVFMLHAAYLIWEESQRSAKWLRIEEASLFSQYLGQQDYFMGLSYALSAAFTIYAFMKFYTGQRGGLTGAIGGVTLAGVMYFGGCFLLGCCGSPMLVVYLSLFGSSYLGFTKPIVLIVTATSIALGWTWMEKKSKTAKSLCAGNRVVIKMK